MLEINDRNFVSTVDTSLPIQCVSPMTQKEKMQHFGENVIHSCVNKKLKLEFNHFDC